MNNVFEFVTKTPELVVIRVNANDNLTVALHPYVDSSYDYISVTRGEKHILTVTKKDGTTFSFHWGKGGYTCISEALEVLKRKVIDFIEQDCKILLGWDDGSIDEAAIFYNKNYEMWQLTLRGKRNKKELSACLWDKVAKSAEDMMNVAESYCGKCGWHRSIAPTGIDVWYAEI